MAWLRLDDGFTKHPKFEGWPKSLRWDWLEAMEYCARYRTGGRLPTDHSLLPRAVTPALLKRAETSGWCSRDESGALWINDWETFNPARQEAVEEAVEQALRNHPDASSNQLVRIVGGNRKQVLELIRRFRTGSANGSEELVPEPVTRAGAPAFPSRPVPSLEEPAAAAASPPVDETAAAATRLRLEHLGLDTDLPDHDLPRAAAWLDLAQHEADTNPAGYVRRGLDTGAWPSPRARTDEPGPVDQTARRRRYVEANGWRLPPDELEYQLTEMGADEDELVGLLETAADLRDKVTA